MDCILVKSIEDGSQEKSPEEKRKITEAVSDYSLSLQLSINNFSVSKSWSGSSHILRR